MSELTTNTANEIQDTEKMSLEIRMKLIFNNVEYTTEIVTNEPKNLNFEAVRNTFANSIDKKIKNQKRIDELGGRRTAINVRKSSKPTIEIFAKCGTNFAYIANKTKFALDKATVKTGEVEYINRKGETALKETREFNSEVFAILLEDHFNLADDNQNLIELTNQE